MAGTPVAGITEKLLSSLLRKDENALAQCLSDGFRLNEFANEIEFQLEISGLAGLFYERACEVNAGELLGQVSLPNGSNLFGYLEAMSRQAAIRAAQMDEKFMALQKLLYDELEQMIWIKSTVLARTLYAKLSYRVGIDFDVVVKPGRLPSLFERLKQDGWQLLFNDPGYCHQIGVGPTKNLDDLFLVPHKELESCHNLTMSKAGYPNLELKFNPLDNGVLMKEMDRFFSEAVSVEWMNGSFKAPTVVDHLVIELIHLHKHSLIGVGWIHDIYMLVDEMNKSPSQWNDFVVRVQKEGVCPSAGVALERVQDLLNAEIPAEVTEELKGRRSHFEVLVNLASTEFIWNANGLPMLVLNALVLGDGRRKLRILKDSFLPDDQFLSTYYANGKQMSIFNRLQCLLLHWLVLILPGGVVRRTFGKALWKTPDGEKFNSNG